MRTRVVLDTNVVVSALLSPKGVPARILDLFFNEMVQVCICDNIVAEYRDVLSRPELRIEAAKIELFLDNIKHTATMTTYVKSSVFLPDEDDRVFYDTAKGSGAILITGNTKHFPEEDFIMTPRAFIDMVKSADKEIQ